MVWNQASDDGDLVEGCCARARGTYPTTTEDRGLTQKRLAHLAGLTKNQIQLIEAGIGSAREGGPPSNLRLKSFFGIAEVLSVPPSELILGLGDIGDSVGREADSDATDPEVPKS